MEEEQSIPFCRIHEAALGRLGSVIRGNPIDEALAIERRRRGKDVVVVGEELKTNRRLALRIEAAAGPPIRHEPHTVRAGFDALPHYQQKTPPPEGHTFYETLNRRSRPS